MELKIVYPLCFWKHSLHSGLHEHHTAQLPSHYSSVFTQRPFMSTTHSIDIGLAILYMQPSTSIPFPACAVLCHYSSPIPAWLYKYRSIWCYSLPCSYHFLPLLIISLLKPIFIPTSRKGTFFSQLLLMKYLFRYWFK